MGKCSVHGSHKLASLGWLLLHEIMITSVWEEDSPVRERHYQFLMHSIHSIGFSHLSPICPRVVSRVQCCDHWILLRSTPSCTISHSGLISRRRVTCSTV